MNQKAPTPPVAPRRPHSFTHHGITVTDDYAWLKDENWQEVLRDPSVLKPDIRAYLEAENTYADAVLAVGEGNGADPVVRMAARAGKPVFSARQRPLAGSGIAGKRVLAFAGIGDPAKFFATVEEAGGEVAMKRAFADHHFYASDELADLAATAARRGLELATTAKDAARIMDGSEAAKKFLENLHVVEIDMVFDPDTIPRQIIGAALAAWRERRLER